MTRPSSIVILTGAGISAPSGIQTFRGGDGLWNGHRIEDVATPEAFITNPKLVHDFYNQRRKELLSKTPNPAHKALAKLQDPKFDFRLITQNVDDLHERGGIKEVIHMHGELLKKRCVDCSLIEPCSEDTSSEDLCSSCEGKIRPDIVWFGEMPFHLNAINSWLQSCQLFVAIGTSGNVYPAAEFVNIAKSCGAHSIEFNLEETAISHHFDEVVLGSVEETIPKWVLSLLNS